VDGRGLRLENQPCNRGIAYAAKGDADKAIADLTEAIRLDPKSGVAYYVRGRVYMKTGEQDKAKADFAQAKRLGFSPK
jgi:Tfp pilus assembly protein PilF